VFVAGSTEDHERIIEALKAGDLTSAFAALKRNMQSGREPIVTWLKNRTTHKGT
jgi:DNA-binding GntR family transcriptional regulator